MKDSQKIISKVIIAGDGAVGKTSIVNSIIEKHCDDVTMTAGINIECVTYEVGIDNKKLTLSLWDFGGQPQFRFFQGDFLGKTDLVVLVFDLSRYSSFNNLKNDWLQFFKENARNHDYNKILVGNKSDLNSVISVEEIEEFSKEESMDYLAVSAEKGENINVLIEKITKYGKAKYFEN